MAILALALGIGGATTMFSVLYGVLIDPFPYKDADRLVLLSVFDMDKQGEEGRRRIVTGDEAREYARLTDVFEGFPYSNLDSGVLDSGGAAYQVRVITVAGNVFQFVGMRTMLGRGILPRDAEPGSPPVAVLSEGAWRRYFAADPNIVNRTILVDQRLTGLLVGQTLYTTSVEIYRALVEATAFGALTIINRFEEYGVKIDQVINCGGIAEKSPLTMQIYADVTGRPMKVSRSAQTCALGAAVAGAVVAGAHKSFASAQKAMTGLKLKIYKPDPKAHEIYRELYALYKTLHDAFGTTEWNGNLYDVMKKLIEIRNAARLN
jgi:hypothetical protein